MLNSPRQRRRHSGETGGAISPQPVIVIEDSPPVHLRSTSPDEVREVIDLTADSEDEDLVVLSSIERFATDDNSVLESPDGMEKRECPICTFHNHMAMLHCEMCGVELTPSYEHEIIDRALAFQLQQEEGWDVDRWRARRVFDNTTDVTGDDSDNGVDVPPLGDESMYPSGDETTTTLDYDETDGAFMSTDEDDFSDEDIMPQLFMPQMPVNGQSFGGIASPLPRRERSGKCDICLEEYDRLEFGGSTCSDAYCIGCWHGYLKSKLQEHKFPCRCPAVMCSTVVAPEDSERLMRLRPGLPKSGAQVEIDIIDTKDIEQSVKKFRDLHVEATMENKIYCPIKTCSRPLSYDPKTATTAKLYCPGRDAPEETADTAVGAAAGPSNSSNSHAMSPGRRSGRTRFNLFPFSRPIRNRIETPTPATDHGHYICATCLVPWHSKLSCNAYRQLEREKYSASTLEEQQTLTAIRAHRFQKCPKCGFWIAKRDGCNHIKCMCGEDFCYICGGSYSVSYGGGPRCRGEHQADRI